MPAAGDRVAELPVRVLLVSVKGGEATPSPSDVKNAAAKAGRVAAERAIVDGQLRVITVDAAACVRRKVAKIGGGPAVCDR